AFRYGRALLPVHEGRVGRAARLDPECEHSRGGDRPGTFARYRRGRPPEDRNDVPRCDREVSTEPDRRRAALVDGSATDSRIVAGSFLGVRRIQQRGLAWTHSHLRERSTWSSRPFPGWAFAGAASTDAGAAVPNRCGGETACRWRRGMAR